MLRRSTRLRDKRDASGDTQMHEMNAASDSIAASSKRTRDDDDDNDSAPEAEDGDDDNSKRKRKKSKKSVSEQSLPSPNSGVRLSESSKNKRQRMPKQFRGVRGKLGLLEKLAKDMPLDVILEIFCYLEPRDLLRLARTTKDLRAILMSKSSVNIWRTVLGNVEGLPPCPTDLNEPQFANLLFEPYCHVCMRSAHCDNILWNIRVRSCQKCLQAFPQPKHIDHPLSRYESVIPTELVEVEPAQLCYISNPEVTKRYMAEYDALQSREDRHEWIKRKRKECRAIQRHKEQCTKWQTRRWQDRADELDALRKERKAAILDRLGEIGWRHEAETIMEGPYDSFSRHKLVKQPKKLTDQGWRTIKNPLVTFLSEQQAERNHWEQDLASMCRSLNIEGLYHDILSKADVREPFPPIGDVHRHQVFQDLIDMPASEDLTEDFLRSKLLEHLPELAKEWQEKSDQKLLEIMQEHRPSSIVSDLHLATTLFICARCRRSLLYYPQLFQHTCYMNPKPYSSGRYTPIDSENPWSSSTIVFSNTFSDHARGLVEACSLDPNTATFQDIYNANPLFECTTCSNSDLEGSRCFMRWPLPLVHGRLEEEHAIVVPILTDEEQTKLVACEPNISSSSTSTTPICCAHCHEPSGVDGLIDHLKTEHNNVVDFLESDEPSMKLHAFRTHWYWNPRMALSSMGQPFRYNSAESSSQPSTVGVL
ncbi:hypothetical protein FB446DRAFT_136038 [Lentinula raphanica]|nr:hypothetical protein FB446DRAFT_136038 [Lentinula raphanica]